MMRTSRVVVVESLADGESDGIAHALAARGFNALQVDEPGTVVAELLSSVRPEALVIAQPGRMAGNRLPAARKLIERLSHSDLTRHLPILVIGQEGGGEAGDPGSAVTELSASASHDELAARIGSLTRLAVLARELERRVKVAGRFGGSALAMPSPAVITDARILVALAPSLVSDIADAAPPSVSVTGAPSLALALDYLAKGDFDVVVVPGTDAAESGSLLDALRRDVRFAEVPVAVAGGDESAAATLLKAGADAVMHGQIDTETSAQLLALASESRYRAAMRETLAAAMPAQVRDAVSGLATHGYFSEWLKAMVADCDRWGDMVSLIAIEVENVRALNDRHGFAPVDRMMASIGSIIANLTRAEDCACRYSGSRLLVGMPNMPLEHLRVVRDRILSIIEQTDFVDDAAMRMTPVLATRTTQWRAGSSALGLIEDAFCGIV